MKVQQYFEACKARGRHPKTKLPLTSDDLRDTLWLFSDNQRMLRQHENKDKMDEDEDDDKPAREHVDVDVGDAPDVASSDPFLKKRAALPDSYEPGEEL